MAGNKATSDLPANEPNRQKNRYKGDEEVDLLRNIWRIKKKHLPLHPHFRITNFKVLCI